ncbi:MAG: NAD-dependent epimerase/dehydratase family protein [Fidelibacterota bacterium]|nr:MAG: NAD-dependent epimerase/dehydratase family protein [Candidatus Neomarinimicrobiota bacterium]
MRVMVTGADGLLGSNLVRELLEQGYEVRAGIQPDRRGPTLDGLEIERIRLDILDPDSITAGIENIDVVVHAAGNTSVNPSRDEAVCRVNFDGTRNVVDSVLKSGVKLLIHVGTANTFGFGSKSKPGNEEQPYRAARFRVDYMDSKYAAHQLVMEAVAERGLPALIVNPTFLIGPYDYTPSSGAMIRAIHNGDIPFSAPGGRNFIAVKDVAKGIVSAIERGKIGEAYIMGHENLTYQEMFNLIASTLQVKGPRGALPKAVIITSALVSSLVKKMLGRQPQLTYALARISCCDQYYSAAKAIDKLNLPQSSLRTAIQESFEWMEQHGVLDRN